MRHALLLCIALSGSGLLAAETTRADTASDIGLGSLPGTRSAPTSAPDLGSPLLQQRALNPLNALFGLPGAASRSLSSREWQVALEHGNLFAGGTAADESLLFDGETSELSLRYRQRLTACWQGELSTHVVAHSGGVFDRPIDDWHQWFSLPDAARSDTPFDQLEYRYVDGEGRSIVLDRASQGIGDLQIAVQRHWHCTSHPRDAWRERILRLGLKLPTGDRSKLTGSGELDLWVDAQSSIRSWTEWLTGAASIGVLLPGRVRDLPRQEHVVAFGVAGLRATITPRLSALVQLDWHTPFFDSQLRELGVVSVALSTGFRYRWSSGTELDVSISEDAAVDTRADIGLRLALTWRPLR